MKMSNTTTNPLSSLGLNPLLGQKFTPIAKHLSSLVEQSAASSTNDVAIPSITYAECIQRARVLPLLAAQLNNDQRDKTLFRPADLTILELRLLGFVPHGFSMRNRKVLQKNISLPQHMMLIAFEAKPRPLSFAMSGYSCSDFVAYIYQDVAARFIDSPIMATKEFTKEKAEEIKYWLQLDVPKKRNSPQRHIKRRLMALLNRKSGQINNLYQDQEVPTDLLILFRKLLEVDEDVGYSYGELRDFSLVRQDFNALCHYVTYSHYEENKMIVNQEDYHRVKCPSVIIDFTSENIDKKRVPKPVNKPKLTKEAKTEKK